MANYIRIRKNTAAGAAANNAILANGEPGFETDTGVFKIGDGVTAWNDLDPISGGGGSSAPVEDEFNSELLFQRAWTVRQKTVDEDFTYTLSPNDQREHSVIEDYLTGDGVHTVTFPNEADGFFNQNGNIFSVNRLNRIIFYFGKGGIVSYTIENLTTVVGLTQLDTPSNVSTNSASSTEIEVSWDAVDDAVSYDVQVSDTGTTGTWSLLANVLTNTYTHEGLSDGTTKYYRIQAKGDGVAFSNSGFSATVSATTGSGSTLSTPSLSITNIDSKTNQLNWSNVSGEDGYQLERSLTGIGSWSTIYTAAANELTFDDDDCTPEVQYFYRVKALGNGSTVFDSAYSTIQNTITNGVATPTLGLSPTNDEVLITIGNIDVNADSTELQRATLSDYSDAVSVEEFTSLDTSVLDEDLDNGELYYYRTRTTVDTINSAWTTGSVIVSAAIISDDFTGTTINTTKWPAETTTGGSNSQNDELIQTTLNVGTNSVILKGQAVTLSKSWAQVDLVSKNLAATSQVFNHCVGSTPSHVARIFSNATTNVLRASVLSSGSEVYTNTSAVSATGKTVGILIDGTSVEFFYWDTGTSAWISFGTHTLSSTNDHRYGELRTIDSAGTGGPRVCKFDNYHLAVDKPAGRYP